MALFGLVVGALGISHKTQMGDGPAQAGWVQPPGRVQQHRFGLGGGVGGEVVGAGGQHLGMGWGDGPGGQGLAGGDQGAAVQGPGGADQAGGGAGAHVEPVAEPGGGGAGRHALFGAGGPAGVHVGQLGQQLAVEAVGQALQGHDPFGPGGVSQPVQGLVDQALELGRHR
jgi:hypothetical protein